MTDSIQYDRNNSVMLLIDYQPAMFRGLNGKADKISIRNAVVASAKAAKIAQVPVIMTSVYENGNGLFIPELTNLFPKQKVIQRKIPGFDALTDPEVIKALKNTKRTHLIIGGLWSSMCAFNSALHATKIEQFEEVYCIVDALGDASHQAHKSALTRMSQYGIEELTWMPIAATFMINWADPIASEMRKEVFNVYSFSPA